MITLAIAQVLYFLVIKQGDIIGGASGLSLESLPPTILPIDLGSPLHLLVLIIMVLVVSFIIQKRILSSPMGDVFRGIRENEKRARLLGYNTFYYKLISLSISGFFSATAGMLWGLFCYLATPSSLHWSVTGDVLMITIFGGIGTLSGPILGSFIFVMIENTLSPITDQWRLFVGMVFVFIVLFIPDGIASQLGLSDE
jgi:branched-chain amino acid transport system permease protein